MSKKTSIVVFITVIAVLFWLTLIPWLKEGAKFQHPGVWLPPIFALIILCASMALGILLLENKKLWALTAILTGLPIFVIFGIQYLYLIFIALLLLFVIIGGHIMKRELHERYKIDVRVMARAGIHYIVIPFLIGISFVYYYSPSLQNRIRDGVLPESFKQTVSESVQKVIQGESGITEETTLVANSAVDEAFRRIEYFFRPYEHYFPPLLAFGLFIVLWSLAFIFNWFSAFTAAFMFYILCRNGFVLIEQKDVKAETIKI